MNHASSMTPGERDTLTRFLRRNDQAITKDEALAVGLRPGQLRRLAERGELRRSRQGLYVVPSASLSMAQRVAVAVRVATTPAYAARFSALALHGIRLPGHAASRPEVVVHGTCRPDLGEGVVVHRTVQLDDIDLTAVAGIPSTTVERAVIDVASGLSTVQRLRLVDQVLFTGAADRDTLVLRSDALQRGRPGVRTILRVASSRGQQRFRSDLERVAFPLLRAAGLDDLQTNVVPRHAPGAGEMDAVSERFRVIVELDGLRFHADGRARQRDNVKGNAAVLGSYTLLRFTWADVMERPERIQAHVRTVIRRAA